MEVYMSKANLRSSIITVVSITLLSVLATMFWVGCDSRHDEATGPTVANQVVPLSKDDPAVQAVMSVQDRHTSGLMADKNVVGTATGMTSDGKLAIYVYLEKAPSAKGKSANAAIPSSIDGIPVVTEVTGKFTAMDNGAAHKTKQTPPIQLGTSGGWRYDLANGYCCGGTLGSLVKIGTTQYILSNYHVLRADIVSGGNSRVATNGDPVIQPALIDVGCIDGNAQNVGTLAGSASLPGSNVDCAIAQVISGMVSSTGSIIDIGTISATTVGASIGQAVKKSGRTTGLGRSSVSGLNATISVAYENECAGGAAFTKTFTGQIVIRNRGSKFLAGGDSGSLMVQDLTTNPRAVGLLYAGSSTSAIANPINEVLSFLGASMVGQ